MSNQQYKVISADSHVVETPEVFSKYIDPAFRSRAPKVVQRNGKETWIVEGVEPRAVSSLVSAAGVKSDKLKQDGRVEDHVKGGWDPHARVKDMDLDGMDAEALYTSMFNLYRIPDPTYKNAVFRAYNDWMADFCGAYPERLIGIGLIALDDVEAAVVELRRMAKKGLRGAAIPSLPKSELTYGDPRYEPFWAEAQDLGMPLSLHVNTNEATVVALTPDYMINFTMFLAQIQMSIASFVSYGVLERFPRLKLVSAENDIGWVATYKARLDHAYKRHGSWSQTGKKLTMLPSEYLHRQVHFTFMYDKAGVDNRQHIGVDNILWASDYPHSDATWPESRRFIDWQFGEIPDAERRKIICDNARALYRI